jgi:predicted ATPase
MIERIVIENFKSFRRAELKLGHLNVLIGTNASGKSNFFDALRVLQGIGYGFTFDEILNGKPKSAASEVWDPIRGGSREAPFRLMNAEEGAEVIRFSVDARDFKGIRGSNATASYLIELSAASLSVRQEELRYNGRVLFSTQTGTNWDKTNRIDEADIVARVFRPASEDQHDQLFNRQRPILKQIWINPPRAEKGIAEASLAHVIAWGMSTKLANIQRLDPDGSVLRSYSQMQQIDRMGERGENFAALVKRICSDSDAKEAFLSWLQELRPAEVDDIKILEGAVGEPFFAIMEGKQIFPATVLSDGTLRFAAIVAAFFQPEMPSILMIEEIENGFHPSRMRLLVELLRSRAGQTGTQVFVTTHSPTLLAWLDPEDYATTFLFRRDEQTGESHVRALTDIAEFNDVVVQKKQPIGELLAQGWLEAAL